MSLLGIAAGVARSYHDGRGCARRGHFDVRPVGGRQVATAFEFFNIAVTVMLTTIVAVSTSSSIVTITL